MVCNAVARTPPSKTLPRRFTPCFNQRSSALGKSRQHRIQQKTKSLLVTNHASLTGLPDPSFLFDVFVNDKAGKLFKDDDDD
jgi:hypothetical protein